MKVLAVLILAYTPLMLLIHLSTARILNAWNAQTDSWISLRFPPRRALRVEALFWAIVVAAWSLWHPLGWKILVIVFGLIHLAIWGAGEFASKHKNPASRTQKASVQRAIIVFDLIEAFVLAAVAVLAVLYLIHPA